MSSYASPSGRLLDGVLDAALAAVTSDALDSPGGADGVAALLARRVRVDAPRPLLTFYDDATGERTELSAATVDNWVAKTSNLLVDTVGINPGDLVRVDLPPHWQTAVVLLASWSAGADVIVGRSGPDADGDPPAAVFLAEDALDAAFPAGDGTEIVALSMRPMNGRLARPVPGVLDFAAEILAHGDRFTPPPPPANQRTLVRLAGSYSRRWELTGRDRILTTAGYDTPEGLLAGLLSPLDAGASVVVCRNIDQALVAGRVASEQVTAICGPIPGSTPQERTPAGARRLRTASA